MVTRYDLEQYGDVPATMEVHQFGDYVDWYSYEELLDKYTELCEKIEDLSRGL